MSEPAAELSSPTSPADTLAQAERFAEGKEWSQAADVLAAAGSESEVLDKRVFYLSRARRYDEALELLGELRRREPDNFLWQYMTAYQYYVQELYADAVPWFREALKRNPKHLKSWWRAANALSKSGEELKAVSCAGKVLRLWHDLPQEAKERERTNLAKASYFLGKVQMGSDPRGAIPLLEQAVAYDRGDPHKHYRLGKALRYAGRPNDAIPHLRQAQRLKLGDTNIELELAICLGRAGEREEALAIIRRRSERMGGWDLYKAGQLALDLDDAHLALMLLERAARDRATRKDERVQAALDVARGAAPAASQPIATGEAVGRVDVVREDRNFGFLVDESGTRRHFRLCDSPRVRVGERVSYVPFEGKKGPAARELRPL